MPEPLSPAAILEAVRNGDWQLPDEACAAFFDLLAALDAERAKVDGPSGLREQLVAARKGEQIEFRLRQQAERERDAERAKLEDAREASMEDACDQCLDLLEAERAKTERLERRLANDPTSVESYDSGAGWVASGEADTE